MSPVAHKIDVRLGPNVIFYFVHPLVFLQSCHFLPETLVDKVENLYFQSDKKLHDVAHSKIMLPIAG